MQQAKPEVRMVIIAGENNMTKTGKVASMFKLLGTVNDYRHDNSVVAFERDETFIVVKGQRGAMNVNLLKDGMEYGLETGNKGRFIYTAPPFKGKEAMRWERHVSRTEDLLTEKGNPENGQEEQGSEAGFRELGQSASFLTDPEAMAEGMWVDPEIGLQAKVQFPEKLLTMQLGKFVTDIKMGNLYFGAVAKNIHRLRGNDEVSLKFAILAESEEPRVAIEEDGVLISWRIDPTNLDMFQGDEISKLGEHIWVTLSEVATYHVPADEVFPQIIEFEEATANVTPVDKVDANEMAQHFGQGDLREIVRAIMLHEQTALSRKWTASWVVRYILNEGSEHGRFIIERVRVNDEPEQVGDVYEINGNTLKLVHHRNLFKSFEGPTFIITPVEYKSDVPERSNSLAQLGRMHDQGGGRESRGGERAYIERGRGYDNRGLVRERVFGERVNSRQEPRHIEEERARVQHQHIPTREWIPQHNQYVTVEGDESGEVYIIQDFDMYTRKFVLKMADSLRAERQKQLGKSDSISVEAGRLRPFTLFY